MSNQGLSLDVSFPHHPDHTPSHAVQPLHQVGPQVWRDQCNRHRYYAVVNGQIRTFLTHEKDQFLQAFSGLDALSLDAITLPELSLPQARPLAASLAAILLANTVFPALSWALPTGESVQAGSVSFSRNGKVMTIQSGSNKSIVNYTTFDIAGDETVNINLPSSSAAILNRVIGGNPSEILGNLNSNGTVFLVNPAGILFGAGAQVNVGSLVASTLSISNQDFLNGNYVFRQDPNVAPASVVNRGNIQVNPGGYAVLLGSVVENHGTITAPGGTVGLAVGEQLRVDVDQDMAVEVQVDEALEEQMEGVEDAILNAGTIAANQSGTVQLLAKLSSNLYERAVNNSGRIEAQGVEFEYGGAVVFRGTNTSGDAIVNHTGTVDVSSDHGVGGTVHVLGDRVALQDDGAIEASGGAGGGEVLVGGDAKGANPDIHNAQMTYVGDNTRITADGTQLGDGGRVIVWADDTTRVYGDISVQGGLEGGNGGFVETSGQHYLEVSSAPKIGARHESGQGGHWLLDPRNIDIVAGAGNTNINAGNPFVSFGDSSQLGVDLIVAALLAGDVTVETGATGGEVGDITLNTTLDFDGVSAGLDRTLTLRAHRNIQLSGDILDSNGATDDQLNVNLFADFDGVGGGRIRMDNATLDSSGGDVVFDNTGSGAQAGDTGALFSNGNVSTGGGNLTFNIQGSNTSGIYVAGTSTFDTQGGDLTINTTTTGGYGLRTDPNAVLRTGGGDMTITASSADSDAIRFNGLVDSQGGDMVLDGTNTGGGDGLDIDTGSTVNSSGGNITLQGNATAQRGVYVNGGAIVNSGGGAITATGVSTNNGGFEVDDSTINSQGGAISLDGTSTTNQGVRIENNAMIVSGSGNVDITGVSLGNERAVYIRSGSSIDTGGGHLTVDGDSATYRGVQIYQNSTVNTGGGNMTILGESGDSESGIYIHDNVTLDSDGGTITMVGTGVNEDALEIHDSTTVRSGGGNLSITGTMTGSDRGVRLYNSAVIDSEGGDLTVTGNSQFVGILMEDAGTIVRSGGGDLEINGTGGTSHGIFVNDDVVVNSQGGQLQIVGISTDVFGVELDHNSQFLTEGGNLTLTGTSTHGTAARVDGAHVDTAGGTINMTGTTSAAGAEDGLYITAGAVIDSNGGSLTLTGNSVGDDGLQIVNNSIVRSGSGAVTLNGSSTNSDAVLTDTNATINSEGGNIVINGSSTAGKGLKMEGTSQISSQGGNITIDGTTTGDIGVYIQDAATLSSSGGNITIDAQSVNDYGFSMNTAGTVNTGGGNLTVRGESTTDSAIYLTTNSNVLTSGGNLSLTGISSTGEGVELRDGATVNSGSGSLQLIGQSDTSYAVQSTDNAVIQSTSGDILLRGTSGSAANTDARIFLEASGAGALSSTSGDITLQGDRIQIDHGVSTGGTVTVETTSSKDVRLGSTVSPSNGDTSSYMELNANELDLITASELSVHAGDDLTLRDNLDLTALGYDLTLSTDGSISTQSHNLTLGSHDLGFSTTNGNIDLGASSIQGTVSTLLSLNAAGGSGSITQSSSGSFAVGRLDVDSGTGNVFLHRGQNNANTVSFNSSSGSVRYTDTNGFKVLSSNVGSGTLYVTANGSGSITNSGRITGSRLVAQANAGNIILNTNVNRLDASTQGDLQIQELNDLTLGRLDARNITLSAGGHLSDGNGDALNLVAHKSLHVNLGGSFGTYNNPLELQLLQGNRVDIQAEVEDGFAISAFAYGPGGGFLDVSALEFDGNPVTVYWNGRMQATPRNRDLYAIQQNIWNQNTPEFVHSSSSSVILGQGSQHSYFTPIQADLDNQLPRLLLPDFSIDVDGQGVTIGTDSSPSPPSSSSPAALEPSEEQAPRAQEQLTLRDH